MTKKEFGARLKSARLVRGLTQHELGSRFGVEQPTIVGYEQGKRDIKADDLLRFAQILGVSVTYFYGQGDIVREDTPPYQAGEGPGGMPNNVGDMDRRIAHIEEQLQELLERLKQTDK